jgi:hypothetical protein
MNQMCLADDGGRVPSSLKPELPTAESAMAAITQTRLAELELCRQVERELNHGSGEVWHRQEHWRAEK